MKPARILVIGESCRDVFVYCDAQRLAPDLPIPVLHVMHQTENPGMAKNVERNVKAIYPHCDIITNDNWRELTKTRYMHAKTNHAFLRVDAGVSVNRLNIRTLPLDDYDIIAISDYDKGFLEREDMRYICEHHNCVFVDTKKPVGTYLESSLYIKINEKEYQRSCPVPESVAERIIMTKGEQGAEYQGVDYPIAQIEVKDSSGAGDSFFAGLLVRYAETGDIFDAIRFANLCASQVVQHRGVTTFSRPEGYGHARIEVDAN